jgi:hypothetical protein
MNAKPQPSQASQAHHHPLQETPDLSHIVEIKTEVRDEAAVKAACVRLQIPNPEHKTVRLFSATATGLCVQLRGWSYPVVCNLQTGQVQYDNYASPVLGSDPNPSAPNPIPCHWKPIAGSHAQAEMPG